MNMRKEKMQATPMETYKQSEAFKKSGNGFDTSAYKAWKECFEMWVIPLAVDVSQLEDENRQLRELLANKK